MLKDGTAYRDLGATHFDKRSAQVKANLLVAQLAKLGYEADLRPVEQAAYDPQFTTARLGLAGICMRARSTPSSNSLILPFMPSNSLSFGRQGSGE
jgi:hypothetical protein